MQGQTIYLLLINTYLMYKVQLARYWKLIIFFLHLRPDYSILIINFLSIKEELIQ